MSVAIPTKTIIAVGTQHGMVAAQTAPTPFQMGRMDALNNYPFCPEMYFVRQNQMAEYAAGFLAVREDCQPAVAFLDNVAADYAELDSIGYEESRYPFAY